MRSRLIPMFIAVVAALGLAVGPAGTAGAASPTPPPVTPSFAPVPSDANATPHAVLNWIACGAPGSCVAVGQYADTDGRTQGLIDTWSSGSWTARKAPLPGDASTTNPGADVYKVACGAAASCVAYASYTSTSPPFTRSALLSLSSDVWSATDFPATLPIETGSVPTLNGAACSGANSCTVVGEYTGTDFKIRGFVAFFHSTWSVIDAPLPGDAIDSTTGTGVLSQLNDVSCSRLTTGGPCIGIGKYQLATGFYEVLVDAISPSTPTANASSKPLLPADDSYGTDLSGISCESTGPCAAYGTYKDASNVTHAVIASLGSNWVHSWAPEQPPVLGNDINPGTFPTLTAIACAHGPSNDGCVLAGNYADSGLHPQPLSDRLSGGTWTADSPPSTRFMSVASCGAPTFCVEADVVNANTTDQLSVLSGTTWYAESAPVPGTATPSATLEATGCDSSSSCFAVGTNGEKGLIEHITVTTAPPSVKLTTPAAPFTLASSTKVSWTGTPGGAAITHYKVQEKKAAWNGGFGAWTTPSAWSNLSASTTHVTAGLSVGVDTCFRVEAFDSAGHSSFSTTRCTAMPLDDKSLTASSGWSRVSTSGYYQDSYSSDTHLHATLTRTGAEFDRVALVATKCPTCGKVGIYSGSTQLATVDLHASSTTHQVTVVLARVSQRTATVTIKVLTSGKTIQIDGLGLTRN